MNSKHVILLAHGSRSRNWQDLLTDGTDELEQSLNPKLGVSLAYMELASPSLIDQVSSAHAAGARNFYIYPLFFAYGVHLQEDIPKQLGELEEKFPDCEFILGKSLAEQTSFWQFIESSIIDFAST